MSTSSSELAPLLSFIDRVSPSSRQDRRLFLEYEIRRREEEERVYRNLRRMSYARSLDAFQGLLGTSILLLSLLWAAKKITQIGEWVQENMAGSPTLPSSFDRVIGASWGEFFRSFHTLGVAIPEQIHSLRVIGWVVFAVLILLLVRYMGSFVSSLRDLGPFRKAVHEREEEIKALRSMLKKIPAG